MSTCDFLKYCEEKVFDYYRENNKSVKIEDLTVFQVWYSKTLQNHKCLMGTNNNDKLYFEFTYNGDKNQLYMDVYDKLKNICYCL